MRIARKQVAIAVAVVAALAFGASTASAQGTVEIRQEVGGVNTHCPALVKVTHSVAGGCHVEFQSAGDVPLFGHIPGVGELQQSNCQVFLEARLDEDGEGWITQATLTAPAGQGPCTRAPCDEADGTFIPWRIHIRETAPATEQLVVTFCLRLVDDPVGTAGFNCSLQLPLTTVAGAHMYRVTASAANRCAEQPIAAIAGTFNSLEADASEKIEIVHPGPC